MDSQTAFAPSLKSISNVSYEVGTLLRLVQPTLSQKCPEVVGGEHVHKPSALGTVAPLTRMLFHACP